MIMSKTVKNNTTDRIAVTVPSGHAGEEPYLFVSVGGINYLLPRGETSAVPPEVAYEIARADRARGRADRRIKALLGEA
jgi:hypothetical protein